MFSIKGLEHTPDVKGYICVSKIQQFGSILSIGVCNVVTDLCVEFLYLLVSRGRGVDGVSFNNESFGSFSEVRYYARDVTLEDVVLFGGVELELAHAAGGWWPRKIPTLHVCTSPSLLLLG